MTIYSLDVLLFQFGTSPMSASNCCFLACIQVSQETGKMVLCSYFLKNFPQFVVIHTVKGFSIINGTDVFLELLCFLHDPTNVGNLVSASSASLKPSFCIWKFLVCLKDKIYIRIFNGLKYAIRVL